jgi:hypothetical protein
MYNIIIASGLLSFALIFSASMMSGNLDFKKSIIISTDNGHVNLGKVYNERALIDVELRSSNENSIIFSAEDLSIGSYMNEIDNKFQTLLDIFNKNKDESNKLSKENLTFKIPGTLTIRAHTKYNAENIPMFDLTLKNKKVIIYENELTYKQVSEELKMFISTEQESFKGTYYIK